MLTLHEDRGAISEKWAWDKQENETGEEGEWFLSAVLLNRPQSHKRLLASLAISRQPAQICWILK